MDAKLFILQGFLIKASDEEFIILILYQGQVTTEVMNHLKIVDHEIQGALWIVICFFILHYNTVKTSIFLLRCGVLKLFNTFCNNIHLLLDNISLCSC